jgi:hypothetical protein
VFFHALSTQGRQLLLPPLPLLLLLLLTAQAL